VVHISVTELEAIGGAIGALMGGGGTLFAAVRGIPMLSGFLTKQVGLIHQRDRAFEERDEAVANAKRMAAAAEAFQLAADGWQAAVEQSGAEIAALRAEIASLRDEVARSREEVHQSREEVRKARELLAQSIVYITSLHAYMKNKGGALLPEMPANLRAEIDSILADKESFNNH
jgi:predicted  nucleic acid-binding Zn-ribbon protein